MAGKRRGPAPEPAAVKRAKGNSGRRPIMTEEMEQAAAAALDQVEADAAELLSPDWLNAGGRKIWDAIAPRLAALNILTLTDASTFGRYCQDFARWLALQKTLDDEGETYESESPHGTYKRAHPALSLATRLNRDLMMMEANFALNPADRQRLFAARAAQLNNPDLFPPAPPREPSRPGGGSPIGRLN